MTCIISSLAFASEDPATMDASLECLASKVNELAKNTQLIDDLTRYNLSPPDPHLLDPVWNELSPEDELLHRILNNKSARIMRAGIKKISLQGEGMLIGRNGGLTAATDKTSDFWQGDEAQFLQAISLPQGKVFMQTEITDESAHLMLIKVSAPIYKPGSKHAIGVLVLGFDQFVVDFMQPCNQ